MTCMLIAILSRIKNIVPVLVEKMMREITKGQYGPQTFSISVDVHM